MIQNYFTIAWRTLSKNRVYSLLNILGLLIGISFSCMLYVYVRHELSFDKFHSKSDRTFRILTIDKRDAQNVRTYGVAPAPLGPALVANYPQVTASLRLHRFVGQVLLDLDGEKFQERNWYTADSNFFEVFNFNFISGDPNTALKNPYSLVLTETMAKKYFGERNPVGDQIENTSFGPVTVTGVIEDNPRNSHLQFDLLFSQVRSDDDWKRYVESWDNFESFTYVVFDNADFVGTLRSEIQTLTKEWLGSFAGSVDIEFQPIEDIYLHSDNIEEGTAHRHGRLSDVYIFSTMGLFLLLIACVNYVNLATAKATMRSKEVGIRKVVGANRMQLINRFMTESFIITFVAAIASILLMDLCFPYFNRITGYDFDITLGNLKEFLIPLAMVAGLVALMSGTYPAFYLAALEPAASLRGRQLAGSGAAVLRKGLVVVQFVLTIVMIVSTVVIGLQMRYISTKDIGFTNEGLMVIDINSGQVRSQFRAVKREYAQIPGVDAVAVSTRVPGEWKNIPELYARRSADGQSVADSVLTYFMGFDEDMLSTYNLTMKAGRYFSSQHDNDSSKIILNESAVDAFGLTEPVGSILKIRTDDGEIPMTVIGVVKDFNFQSLHQKVAPIIIGAWNNPFHYLDYFTLKIVGDLEDAIAAASKVHDKFDERSPIEYHFLDQQMESYYENEKRAGMIFVMGGVLSIAVACLGLFGLATYNIQRRTKELGVRKLLGATGLNLFLLLSLELAKQVAIAFAIATPLSWYMMKLWLDEFAYRIPLHAGIFLFSGVLALLIALLTISYRTVAATRTNPIQALKQE